jgi:tRNA-dihydrouridine synthase B
MRKFGIKYSQLHPAGRAVRDAFVAVTGPDQWRAVFERYYSQDQPGRHPTVEVDETVDCEVG